MLGTSGCIGAGLDCDDLHLVCRIGLPTSVLNFIQEMGRCGRQGNNDSTANDGVVDTMSIIFILNDFVYLKERLFVIDLPENEEEDNSNTGIIEESSKSILSNDDQRKHQTIDILRVLQLFCLNCWHVIFERECANPYYHYQHNTNNDINQQIQEYGSMCPHCDGTKERTFRRVIRNGICNFLVSSFIVRNDGELMPDKLAKQLFEFPSFGKVVYNR